MTVVWHEMKEKDEANWPSATIASAWLRMAANVMQNRSQLDAPLKIISDLYVGNGASMMLSPLFCYGTLLRAPALYLHSSANWFYWPTFGHIQQNENPIFGSQQRAR